MNKTVRILLIVIAAVFLWWVVFKRRAKPAMAVQPPTPGVGATANAAAAQVLQSAGAATGQGVSNILGVITGGVASSIGGWFKGSGGYGGAVTGSYSSETNPGYVTDSYSAASDMDSASDSFGFDGTI
jgi:hypothetical protein